MSAVFVAVLALAVTSQSNFCAYAEDLSASDKNAHVAKIMAAWRKRQDAIHTVRATLDLHTVVKLGTFRLPPRVPAPTKAKKEYTRSVTVLLDFVNKRYRVDTTHRSSGLDSDDVTPEEKTSTFVDGKGKGYMYHHAVTPKPQGTIGREHAVKFDLGETFMQTLLLHVRPCGGLPGLTTCWPELGPLRIISAGSSGSAKAIECECARSGADARLLVDATRDYAVVRIGSEFRQLTIDYGPDEGYGPVPTQSTFVLSRRGQIQMVTTARVKKIEINTALTDSMFEFEFPEGTEVTVVDTVPRPKLVANAHGQLIPRQRMEAGTRSRGTWIRVWIVAASIVILLVLAGFVLRRRLQRA